MNNIYEFPRHHQRFDEASVWIAKLDNELSAAEREVLQVWMAADQENQIVLLEMARLWDKMGALSRLSDLFPRPAEKPARLPRFAFAAAAVVLLAVFVGFWSVGGLEPGIATDVRQAVIEADSDSVYETAIGEQSSVRLPDGTQLVLNTNSLIEVKYTDQYRLLRLERGEIHVQVAHDKARPLSVFVGEAIVKAVGTAFSLEIDSNQQIELVVTEGKVLVGVHQSTSGGAGDITPDIQISTSVTLASGEQMILGAPEEEITEVSPDEIEVMLSWRQGNLIFRGELLEDAVAEIGRYTTVEFVIVDDNLKKVRIAGLFKAGDVDGLLATLRENFDITYERTDEGKILLTSL